MPVLHKRVAQIIALVYDKDQTSTKPFVKRVKTIQIKTAIYVVIKAITTTIRSR